MSQQALLLDINYSNHKKKCDHLKNKLLSNDKTQVFYCTRDVPKPQCSQMTVQTVVILRAVQGYAVPIMKI